jgi:hypothetical protein
MKAGMLLIAIWVWFGCVFNFSRMIFELIPFLIDCLVHRRPSDQVKRHDEPLQALSKA